MMKRLILLIALGFSLSSFALQVKEVSGKVESFDEKKIILSTGRGTEIEVPRALVSKDLKPGQTLTLNLGEDEVKLVKETQLKKK